MLDVALIGLGAIGQALLKCLAATDAGVRVLGAIVSQPDKAREATCPLFASLDVLLAAGPDLVVECARHTALRELGPRVLARGGSLLAASAGALAESGTHDTLMAAARAGGGRLFIPAGALAGVDALAAARYVGLDRVEYQRRAPPSTWARSGAMSAADAASLSVPRIVYEGTAREAALRCPRNANVAATIALAGIGFDRTRVTLLADPSSTGNVHSVRAEGAFGRFHADISARPVSPGSTSSPIVAGSLARAIHSRISRIAVV